MQHIFLVFIKNIAKSIDIIPKVCYLNIAKRNNRQKISWAHKFFCQQYCKTQ